MGKPFYFLFLLIFTPLVSWAQTDTSQKRPVIFDTVIVEKPPFVVTQTVYVPGKRGLASQKLLSINVFANLPINRLQKENFTLNYSNSFSYSVTGGIFTNFLKIDLGLGVQKINKELTLEWRQVTSIDSTEAYKIDSTKTAYVIEPDTSYYIYRYDTTYYQVYDTTYQNNKETTGGRLVYVQVPVIFSIPFYYKELIFLPEAGIVFNFLISSKIHNGDDRKNQLLTPGPFFISGFLGFRASYPVSKKIHISAASSVLVNREKYFNKYLIAARVGGSVHYLF